MTRTHPIAAVVEDSASQQGLRLHSSGGMMNAIVHDRGKAPVLLADPRDDVVLEIEKIWNRLAHPRKLLSIRRSVPLCIFAASAALAESLSYMRAHEFSQVITVRDGKHVVLSTEGIARWLEVKSKEDVIALSDTRLTDVLDFEPIDSCTYLKADDTVDRAREVFAKDTGKRLFSALVTENGRPKETPINIVPPWDFVTGKLL